MHVKPASSRRASTHHTAASSGVAPAAPSKTTHPATRTAKAPQAPIPTGASLASRTDAPKGTSKPMELRLQELAGASQAGRVDGLAFCARTFEDIKARVALGQPCAVVFDLDNTLFDTRVRTLEIAHAFDAAGGTSFFSKMTTDMVGRDGQDTAMRMALPPEDAARFAAVWAKEFWNGDNLVHDTPMESMVALARQAKEAGASVLYLTGRNTLLQPASLAQLKRAHLPDANEAHLFCKPVGSYTPDYKAQMLATWQDAGTHLGFFVTEGRRDIARVQEADPKVPCLLLPCSTERDGEPIKADTPTLPGVF